MLNLPGANDCKNAAVHKKCGQFIHHVTSGESRASWFSASNQQLTESYWNMFFVLLSQQTFNDRNLILKTSLLKNVSFHLHLPVFISLSKLSTSSRICYIIHAAHGLPVSRNQSSTLLRFFLRSSMQTRMGLPDSPGYWASGSHGILSTLHCLLSLACCACCHTACCVTGIKRKSYAISWYNSRYYLEVLSSNVQDMNNTL